MPCRSDHIKLVTQGLIEDVPLDQATEHIPQVLPDPGRKQAVGLTGTDPDHRLGSDAGDPPGPFRVQLAV